MATAEMQKLKVLANELHDQIFMKFWRETYPVRISAIDCEVGKYFREILEQHQSLPDLLHIDRGQYLSERNNRVSNLRNDDESADISKWERAFSLAREYAYRDVNGIPDPSSLIPCPDFLPLQDGQTRDDNPVIAKNSLCKRRAAKWLKKVTWILTYLVVPCGLGGLFLVFSSHESDRIIGMIGLVVAGLWFIMYLLESGGLSEDVEFAGDKRFSAGSRSVNTSTSIEDVYRVGMVYHEYMQARYPYLSDMQVGILATYLTGMYYWHILNVKDKRFRIFNGMVLSLYHWGSENVDVYQKTFKLIPEDGWDVALWKFSNFVSRCNGGGIDPEGLNPAKIRGFVDGLSEVKRRAKIDAGICETDIRFIEPILYETFSEERFAQIFDSFVEALDRTLKLLSMKIANA